MSQSVLQQNFKCSYYFIFDNFATLDILFAKISFFKKLGFTPHQVKQPLQGMELHEKEDKNETHIGKPVRKKPTIKCAYNSRIKNHLN